ncbi:MAG: hypothetical protein Ct9H300mP28_07390 [Pseudomonadota bacterium]|nr:MAG: hypothetical protein Ct9H300mP28_07390 [Pseudomonadota bacterium]
MHECFASSPDWLSQRIVLQISEHGEIEVLRYQKVVWVIYINQQKVNYLAEKEFGV